MAMFTLKYFGYFIHGYVDRPDCEVQGPDGTLLGGYRTLRLAKNAVRKAIHRRAA